MQSKPQNYVALIYMDLDRLEKYLLTMLSLQQHYRQLSRRTRSAVHHGVICGCAVISPSRDEPRNSPFEIMLIGGDDAILFVAAHEAGAFLGASRRAIANPSFRCRMLGPRFPFPPALFGHTGHTIISHRAISRASRRTVRSPRGIGVQYWTLCSRLKPEHRLLFDGVFVRWAARRFPLPFGMGLGRAVPLEAPGADLVELWILSRGCVMTERVLEIRFEVSLHHGSGLGLLV